MRVNLTVFQVFLLIFLANSIQKSMAETIIIGAEDSWAPFSQNDGKGLSNTIVKEAFARHGIDVKFLVAPYARLLEEVETGNLLALFNVTKEPSTQETYLFGEQKLFTATTAYFYHKDHPLLASTFREVSNGERIGMIIGYEYGPIILRNDKISPIRVKRQTQLVKMLLKKRLDAAIMFDAIANKVFKEIEGSENILRAFDGQHSDIYVAFSRKFPNAEKYMNLLDKGLMEMKKNGQVAKMLAGKAY